MSREEAEQRLRNAATRANHLRRELEAAKTEMYNAIVHGAEVGLDGYTLSSLSGFSKSTVHRHLAKAGKDINAVARYYDFEETAFVFVEAADDSPLNVDSVLSLASSGHTVDKRVLPLLKYLVVVLKNSDYQGKIVADWKLDPISPIMDGSFRPIDASDTDSRGNVGLRFSMQGEKQSKYFTWSRDIKDLLQQQR